ncbi:MAG TPA: hypothetical protein VFN17_00040 [Nitrosarchaeum sp.]|nr:hypothetical protein [Nitrosarchaeum sp.]
MKVKQAIIGSKFMSRTKKEAFSLRQQIFDDQEIRERLEKAIKYNQQIVYLVCLFQ